MSLSFSFDAVECAEIGGHMPSDQPKYAHHVRHSSRRDGKMLTAIHDLDSSAYGNDENQMISLLHIPPVWLVFCIFLAWCQGRFLPLGMSVDHPVTHMMAGLLIGAGLLLMAAALHAFWRHKTTVIPHREPQRLITDGVFARTRNPIYLGDALLLAALILRFDAVPSLVLVPIFVWWIEHQFIVPEEDRMRRAFRAEFARYEQKVRRWI